jgi:hypothetical protein
MESINVDEVGNELAAVAMLDEPTASIDTTAINNNNNSNENETTDQLQPQPPQIDSESHHQQHQQQETVDNLTSLSLSIEQHEQNQNSSMQTDHTQEQQLQPLVDINNNEISELVAEKMDQSETATENQNPTQPAESSGLDENNNELKPVSNITVAAALDATVDDNDANLEEDEDNLIKEINEYASLADLNDEAFSGDTFAGISDVTNDAANSNVSSHTFRKTEWDVKKLENHVRLTYGDQTVTENMTPIQLNTYLKSFFEHAKKSDGMEYEPESLIGFMNSFERYLKTKNYPESLLRSEAFKDARTFLKKKRELVRSIGRLIRTKTTDTFYLLQYHRNLLKEKGLLSRENPDCLLAEVCLIKIFWHFFIYFFS